MGKKIFWGIIYLIAAGMTALTIWLYVVPEREIQVAEQVEGEAEISWIDMPVFTLRGVPVDIGRTRVQALLDGGLTLKFYRDGELLELDLENSVAESRMQYSMMVYDGDEYLADIGCTNTGETSCRVEECSVDLLDVRSSNTENGQLPAGILVGETEVAGLTMAEIPEKFPEFTEDRQASSRYLFTAMTPHQSMVAYFSGDGTADNPVVEFGIRNYAPGSVE